MRRTTLAMALGLGFGLAAGCSPTASDPGDTPAPAASKPPANDGGGTKATKGGMGAMKTGPGMAGEGGGAGGQGAPSAAVTKGMASDAYRNMPGSQGPGAAAKGGAGGAAAPKGGPGSGSVMPEGYAPPPGTTGPGGAPAAPPKKDDTKKDDAKKDDTKKDDTPKADPVVLDADELKNIEKLTDPADRKLALAQKVCLVSADAAHLGAMGVPVKQVVKGKTIFLCCKSCIEDLKADPDKYLAKLAK